MKKLVLLLFISLGMLACSETEPEKYTSRELTFDLQKSSDYDFTGKLIVRELVDKTLELSLKLEGTQSSTEYAFPAHLHFGGYDEKDAPIAYLLNPVSAKNLQSTTVISKLSDGNTLSFEAMQVFDGHVKIHLAADGPDYQVILVAGNVGGNPTSFDPSQMAICGDNF